MIEIVMIIMIYFCFNIIIGFFLHPWLLKNNFLSEIVITLHTSWWIWSILTGLTVLIFLLIRFKKIKPSSLLIKHKNKILVTVGLFLITIPLILSVILGTTSFLFIISVYFLGVSIPGMAEEIFLSITKMHFLYTKNTPVTMAKEENQEYYNDWLLNNKFPRTILWIYLVQEYKLKGINNERMNKIRLAWKLLERKTLKDSLYQNLEKNKKQIKKLKV